MIIFPFFNTSYDSVYDTVKWSKRDAGITDADGKIIFEMKDVEVPEQWSQLATDIVASKYFRKAGIPVYGVSGLFGDIDDVRAHGQNERIRIESFFDGQEFLYRLTTTLSRSDTKQD